MNARLKELINNADDGQADALTLAPGTLKAVLQEIEKMCHSSDTILCEPVAGGPGFKLQVREGNGATTASTYALAWSDTVATAYTDFWDISTVEANGGQDISGVALFPTYDSVSWKGARIVSSVTTAAGPYNLVTDIAFSRRITVDTEGRIAKIGAEHQMATISYLTT